MWVDDYVQGVSRRDVLNPLWLPSGCHHSNREFSPPTHLSSGLGRAAPALGLGLCARDDLVRRFLSSGRCDYSRLAHGSLTSRALDRGPHTPGVIPPRRLPWRRRQFVCRTHSPVPHPVVPRQAATKRTSIQCCAPVHIRVLRQAAAQDPKHLRAMEGASRPTHQTQPPTPQPPFGCGEPQG